MKILFGISTEQDIQNPKMGSERQFIGYANALADLGHEVTIVNLLKSAPDWSYGYDVLHMVNASGLKGPYILAAQMAKNLGIPVFLTPVYWPIDEVEQKISDVLNPTEAQRAAQKVKFSEHLSALSEVCQHVDWLLPNAKSEMEEVLNLLDGFYVENIGAGKENKPSLIGYTVVPNGINIKEEINFSLSDDEPFSPQFEELLADRFISCVGRVEVRKNQHSLIRAMEPLWQEDPELQLVLMGERSAPYLKYLKGEIKGRNVLYCPPGPPSAVFKIIRRSICHALISYIETPGLVNLEAAALNKPIVVADRGSVRDYFDSYDGVFYCDPNDVSSITKALNVAMSFGDAEDLGETIRSNYSYESIALKLVSAYNNLIN